MVRTIKPESIGLLLLAMLSIFLLLNQQSITGMAPHQQGFDDSLLMQNGLYLPEDDPKQRLFERQVYTEDGIRPEDLPRFQSFVNKRSNLLLEEIDNWLTQLEKPNEPTNKRVSTGLGIFNYVHKGD